MLINKINIDSPEDWIDMKSVGMIKASSEMDATPSLSNFESTNVKGRRRHYETSYTHRDISFEAIVSGTSRVNMLENVEKVVSMLTGEFSMKFTNEPNRIYREVNLSKEVEREFMSNTVMMLKISLTAYDPYKYGVNKIVRTINDLIVDTSEFIVNDGNFITKPIIKLSGVAEEITLTTNGRSTTYVNLMADELVVIDSERLTVRKTIDEVTSTALNNWRDDFIELKPGANEILITGTGMNLDIVIEYRNTFL